jgi:hypothetical protein
MLRMLMRAMQADRRSADLEHRASLFSFWMNGALHRCGIPLAAPELYPTSESNGTASKDFVQHGMAVTPSSLFEAAIVRQPDNESFVSVHQRCEQLKLIAFPVHDVYRYATIYQALRGAFC